MCERGCGCVAPFLGWCQGNEQEIQYPIRPSPSFLQARLFVSKRVYLVKAPFFGMVGKPTPKPKKSRGTWPVSHIFPRRRRTKRPNESSRLRRLDLRVAGGELESLKLRLQLLGVLLLLRQLVLDLLLLASRTWLLQRPPLQKVCVFFFFFWGV